MKTENFYRKTENFLVLAYIGLSPGNDMLFLYKIVFTLTLNSFEDDSDQIASKFSVISKPLVSLASPETEYYICIFFCFTVLTKRT